MSAGPAAPSRPARHAPSPGRRRASRGRRPGGHAGIELWEPVPSPGAPGFRTLWQAISRRKRIIALVFAGTVLAIGAWTLTTRPVYTANVTLRIEKEEPRVLKFEDVIKSADPMPDYYQTQQRLLQSRTLANRVIALLNLDQHPDFTERGRGVVSDRPPPRLGRKLLADWVPRGPAAAPPEAMDDLALESPLTRVFLGRLSVEPVRSSRLVKVSFESHYAPLAARVANTLAEAFVSQTLELRADASRYATGFLGRQMGEARGRLEKAEERLSAFVREKGLNFVGSDRLHRTRGPRHARARILSDAFVKARNERIAKESLAEEAREGGRRLRRDGPPESRRGQAEGRAGHARGAAARAGANIPAGVSAHAAARAEHRGASRADPRRGPPRCPGNRGGLPRRRSRTSARSRRRWTPSAARPCSLGDHLVQYNILRRDVDASRELYTSLLTRLKETQISGDLITSPISIVDRAEVPLQPSRPARA